MRWIDDVKGAVTAFKDWGRSLMVLGAVVAGALVAIAAELLVICIKL